MPIRKLLRAKILSTVKESCVRQRRLYRGHGQLAYCVLSCGNLAPDLVRKNQTLGFRTSISLTATEDTLASILETV